MDITIVEATPDDAGELLTLQRAAYLSEGAAYQSFTLPPLTETLAEVRAATRELLVLKAVAGTRIVGAVRARVEGDTGHVGRLAVAPDVQGLGVGTALLRAVEERLPGVRRFELFTGRHSEANLRLYRRLGYVDLPDRGHPVLVFLEKHRRSDGSASARELGDHRR
jgi:ribosomal protein S18 acetylase RimI-like enzyme